VDQELITNLFEKYLRNECSPTEVDQLVNELDHPENREFVKDLILREMHAGLEVKTVWSGDLTPALDERWASILTEINGISTPQAKYVRFPWPRLVAAVAIGLIGLAGYWLFWTFYNRKIPQAATVKIDTDLPPGRNKAFLTLAGGSTIILDSVQNGTLVNQGNTTIIKSDSGQLVYRTGNQGTAAVVYNTLSTPRGGQFQLDLPDGTKVWLNAASSITYPTAFIGASRTVELTGEAYFEVAKNISKPFKVLVKGKENIEVLGTSFNVNAYSDELETKTTLLEGSLRVSEEPLVGVNTNNTKPSVVLKQGQQAQIVVGANTNNGSELKVIRNVDVEEAVAWKNGRFQLGATDFSALMRQLARWYDVDIVYEGKIPEKKFGGSINRNVNLSRLREVLHDYGIETTMEGQKLIIMK